MDKTDHIIAIRKRDITLAHEAFVELMSNTESILNREACENPQEYKKLSSSSLEVCSVEKIKMACANSPFDAKEVKLISGQKFPDIVADKYYGIAVTHSPRYLIDMELEEKKTIFSKMGTTYDDFRSSADSISLARRYYRERAKQQNRQEMPWWITSDNLDQAHSFNIRLWNSLELDERRRLQAMCMILFPEALNPARSMTKYNNTTLWLCSYNQVVNPNIRDLYSAGGKISHVDGKKLKNSVAQVFNIIVDYSDEIKALLRHPSNELLLMIKDFNPILLKDSDMYEAWLRICCKFAEGYQVPLREWIDKKPHFTFSK